MDGIVAYECKTSAQERPYTSRPSRTQQLLNPKLVPKLTSDVPNDLLRKKGIADEQLAKKEEERGRKRSLHDDNGDPLYRRQPSRSVSSSSFSSISTVSTNKSSSRSPAPHVSSIPASDARKRRRRSVSSSASASSRNSYDHDSRQSRSSRYRDRNTRLRRSSTSPAQRGRRRSRSTLTPIERDSQAQKRAAHSPGFDRRKMPRHRRSLTPSSPSSGSDDDNDNTRMQTQRDESQSRPRPRHHEGAPRPRRGHDRLRDAQRRYSNDDDRYGSSYRDPLNTDQPRRSRPPPASPLHSRPPPPPPSQQQQRRERSLSPFSKRLALTQAMNMGR